MSPLQDRPKPERVEAAAWSAIRAIPPAWPLEATVAVNPYLGQAGLDLAAAGARLARTWGAATTMPAAWYEARIARGEILEADLLAALADAPGAIRRLAPAGLVAAARDAAPPTALATVAELAAEVSGVDWPSILQDRMTAWAAGWFDEGQALWRAPRGASAFASWRLTATHDLTPEILGLAGFAAHVANAPDTPLKAIERAVAALGLSEAALELYFHRALASLGGWSQLARQKLWQAELAGGSDETALALLAARLVWDEALHRLYAEDLAQAWPAARARFAEPVVPTAGETALAVLQTAYERAVQRRLLPRLGQPAAAKATSAQPALQAAFCIDVRSEVFRRALESLDDRIETLGFAGFFGLGVEHRRFASDVPERRLPVLLNPAVHTTAAPAAGTADWKARIAARGARAWGRFKLAAVSSFAFVEASGPFYAAKLLADSLGLHGPHDSEEPAPRLLDDLSAEARTQAAETILRAMSLTETFAPLVLLVGHGAQVTNNPHASALHCGACGGYPGEVNARLLAGLLNEPAVRAGLTLRGIRVPEDTRFVAALHDTTSDRVELFAADVGLASLESDRAKAWLEAAGRLARAERARRLPGARDGDSVLRRGGDWAEVRPEWALAGCQAFVAAPRAASAGADLGGRVFLHDYAWRRDSGFKVLELILTAPVVVASWISLQYYGSTVSPAMFGAGDKLLHNVVGGIGVLEGGTGPLRVGLPRQSVHDGEAFVHDPVRLSVCIAAPREAITEILRRHEGVRALFDNGWLSLFVLNDQGQAVARYRPGLTWEPLEIAAPRGAGERAAA